MEFFQLVLPVYVDYLGAFEEGLEDIHEPVDVVQELNLHEVQQQCESAQYSDQETN